MIIQGTDHFFKNIDTQSSGNLRTWILTVGLLIVNALKWFLLIIVHKRINKFFATILIALLMLFLIMPIWSTN
jgi:hypothetical protein